MCFYCCLFRCTLAQSRSGTRPFSELHSVIYQLISKRDGEIRDSAKAKRLKAEIDNEKFFVYVAYMSDCFRELNFTCLQMQGENVNMFTVSLFCLVWFFTDICFIKLSLIKFH